MLEAPRGGCNRLKSVYMQSVGGLSLGERRALAVLVRARFVLGGNLAELALRAAGVLQAGVVLRIAVRGATWRRFGCVEGGNVG